MQNLMHVELPGLSNWHPVSINSLVHSFSMLHRLQCVMLLDFDQMYQRSLLSAISVATELTQLQLSCKYTLAGTDGIDAGTLPHFPYIAAAVSSCTYICGARDGEDNPENAVSSRPRGIHTDLIGTTAPYLSVFLSTTPPPIRGQYLHHTHGSRYPLLGVIAFTVLAADGPRARLWLLLYGSHLP